jgi:hypothetical protein
MSEIVLTGVLMEFYPGNCNCYPSLPYSEKCPHHLKWDEERDNEKKTKKRSETIKKILNNGN